MLHPILIIYLMAKYDSGTRLVHAPLQNRTKNAGSYISLDKMALERTANRMLFRQFSKTLLRSSLSTLSQNIVNMNHRWGSLLKTRQPGDGSLLMASKIISFVNQILRMYFFCCFSWMEWAFSFSPIYHLLDYNSDKKNRALFLR